MPHGALLGTFAEAVCRRRADLASLRTELAAAVGPEGVVEAAATVAIFNGLVRVADGTGIPLDEGTAALSARVRAHLGLDRFAGAANTVASPLSGSATDPSDVRGLFA